MNNPNALPRFDLREKAFRRYEKYIAQACQDVVIMHPFLDLGIKQDSFVARFKDAVLGYLRYRYDSKVIPTNAPLVFRVTPLLDGTVEITPRHLITAVQPGVDTKLNRESVKITLRQLAWELMKGPVYYNNLSPGDSQWLLDEKNNPEYNDNLAMKLEGNRMMVL